jgi:hypothetical protein
VSADGIFAEWQPVYAEAGIPTFPVRNKKPAVRGYLKTGPNLSANWRGKFGDASALGFACKRAGLTIVDVDTPDENVLADALAEYGDTPVIVRSGSNHFQAWYRNDGEPRKIRPDKEKPIDILGGGYVVAPPSQGSKGAYQFLSGSLDDLPALPTLRKPEAPDDRSAPAVARVNVGQRNDALWRACMRYARGCASFDDLLSYAYGANVETLAEPLPDSEVVTLAQSAWSKTCSGDNRFGAEMVVGLSATQFERIGGDPFALTLAMTLRHRWRNGETFAVANAMAETMGWPRKKFAAARSSLEASGLLVMVRPPIKGGGPAVYRFG